MAAADLSVFTRNATAKRDADRTDKVTEDALARIRRAEDRIRRMTRIYQERLDGKTNE